MLKDCPTVPGLPTATSVRLPVFVLFVGLTMHFSVQEAAPVPRPLVGMVAYCVVPLKVMPVAGSPGTRPAAPSVGDATDLPFCALPEISAAVVPLAPPSRQ